MSDNQKIETVGAFADKVKIFLAVVVVLAGIFANYWFAQDGSSIQLAGWVRGLIFLASLLIAAGLVWLSPLGKQVLGFGYASFNEMRRVVWPTRKETVQMTGVVFAFVMAMALFLWIVDKLVEWIIYGQFLGWGG